MRMLLYDPRKEHSLKKIENGKNIEYKVIKDNAKELCRWNVIIRKIKNML
ncbi:MAG: hypothetical protein IEMM0003_0127 [bacterium]|nr:MAG: hypothetical protein IEMM0003_0127 [bacterium]